MCTWFSRLFFKIYPSKKKEARNHDAVWLRKMCLLAGFIHGSLALLAMALIGFWPMIFNLLQFFWIYSCYLTLREREVVFYLVILLVQTSYCVCRILGVGEDSSEEKGTFQSLGNIIILCFLVLLGYLIGKAEWDFHQRGDMKAVDSLVDPEDQPVVVVDNAGDDKDDGFKA